LDVPAAAGGPIITRAPIGHHLILSKQATMKRVRLSRFTETVKHLRD
jgi:hypothetical protein